MVIIYTLIAGHNLYSVLVNVVAFHLKVIWRECVWLYGWLCLVLIMLSSCRYVLLQLKDTTEKYLLNIDSKPKTNHNW